MFFATERGMTPRTLELGRIAEMPIVAVLDEMDVVREPHLAGDVLQVVPRQAGDRTADDVPEDDDTEPLRRVARSVHAKRVWPPTEATHTQGRT